MASRMLPSSHRPAPPAGGAGSSERGSALLISVLVMVILTLLGISYLMLAQTESQIAENELNAQQALFVAEAGARTVMNWFNDPTGTGYKVPTVAQMNRGIRWYDHDGNPGTAVVQGVAGNPTTPIYRDGTDDPFEKAYRGNNFLASWERNPTAAGTRDLTCGSTRLRAARRRPSSPTSTTRCSPTIHRRTSGRGSPGSTSTRRL